MLARVHNFGKLPAGMGLSGAFRPDKALIGCVFQFFVSYRIVSFRFVSFAGMYTSVYILERCVLLVYTPAGTLRILVCTPAKTKQKQIRRYAETKQQKTIFCYHIFSRYWYTHKHVSTWNNGSDGMYTSILSKNCQEISEIYGNFFSWQFYRRLRIFRWYTHKRRVSFSNLQAGICTSTIDHFLNLHFRHTP